MRLCYVVKKYLTKKFPKGEVKQDLYIDSDLALEIYFFVASGFSIRSKVEINFHHRPCAHVYDVPNDIEKSTILLYLRDNEARVGERKMYQAKRKLFPV